MMPSSVEARIGRMGTGATAVGAVGAPSAMRRELARNGTPGLRKVGTCRTVMATPAASRAPASGSAAAPTTSRSVRLSAPAPSLDRCKASRSRAPIATPLLLCGTAAQATLGTPFMRLTRRLRSGRGRSGWSRRTGGTGRWIAAAAGSADAADVATAGTSTATGTAARADAAVTDPTLAPNRLVQSEYICRSYRGTWRTTSFRRSSPSMARSCSTSSTAKVLTNAAGSSTRARARRRRR
mmetsp:Transcript_11857/g.32485  ORF Transcript_11857/g.32485 Transcript_11857/m.32485 type:complete len:239 (+) Transcript_11857:180-896(+)